MRLGASLLRGLSPSRRKYPSHGTPVASSSTSVHRVDTREPTATVASRAAFHQLQCPCADKTVSGSAAFFSSAFTKQSVTYNTERVVSPSLGQAAVFCAHQGPLGRTAPSFSCNLGASNCDDTNSSSSIRSRSRGMRRIINSHSITNNRVPTHARDTITDGVSSCGTGKSPATPPLAATSEDRGLLTLTSAGCLEIPVEEGHRRENKESITDTIAASTQHKGPETVSTLESAQTLSACEHTPTVPPADEICGTKHKELLPAKLRFSRASSRSRLARTLTAATGSVLRRLTPHSVSRCSTSSTPLPSMNYATSAPTGPASTTVQHSSVASAARAAADAAECSFPAIPTLPVAAACAALSCRGGLVAGLGAPPPARLPPTDAVSKSIHVGRNIKVKASLFTAPQLASTCRSVLCGAQLNVASEAAAKHVEQERRKQGLGASTALTVGSLYRESASAAGSTKIECNLRPALIEVSMPSHGCHPSVPECKSTIDLQPCTPASMQCIRNNCSLTCVGCGSTADRGQRGALAQSYGSQTTLISTWKGKAGCVTGKYATEGAATRQDKDSTEDVNRLRDCAHNNFAESCTQPLLGANCAPHSPRNKAGETRQLRMKDGQLSESPERKSTRPTPSSSGASSFKSRCPSARGSTQRRSSRSARICYEKISHQRVEALYVCPEGVEFPVLRSLKVTQETTRKEETIHQQDVERNNKRPDRTRTTEHGRCPATPRQQCSHKQTIDKKGSEEEGDSSRDGGKEEADEKDNRELEEKTAHRKVHKEKCRCSRHRTRGCRSCLAHHIGGACGSRSSANGTTVAEAQLLRLEQSGQKEKPGVPGEAESIRCFGSAPEEAASFAMSSPSRRSQQSKRALAGAYDEKSHKGTGAQLVAEEHDKLTPSELVLPPATGGTRDSAATPMHSSQGKNSMSCTGQSKRRASKEAGIKPQEYSSGTLQPTAVPESLCYKNRGSPSLVHFSHSTCSSTADGSPTCTESSLKSGTRAGGNLSSTESSPGTCANMQSHASFPLAVATSDT